MTVKQSTWVQFLVKSLIFTARNEAGAGARQYFQKRVVHREGGMHGARGACMVAGGCAWLLGGYMVVGDVHGCQGACVVAGGMHGCWGACVVAGEHVWLLGGMCGCWEACVVAGGAWLLRVCVWLQG